MSSKGNNGPSDILPPDPFIAIIQAIYTLFLCTIFGHLRDFLRAIKVLPPSPMGFEKEREGYVPLYSSFENFYRRNIMSRAIDLFNNTISGMAGPITETMERKFLSDFRLRFTGRKQELINMSSYNYLEMNQKEGLTADSVEKTIKSHGVALCSPYQELGRTDLHSKLESDMASFLGVEDALVVGMGFATNSTIIPTILKSGVKRADDCLVLSDEKNHSSIALGCKLSGCVVQRFNHNDMGHLESLLKTGILEGNPKTKRPYKKMLIIVEGVYSMEGTIVNLPEVIRLKKKYHAYVYLDEAHSIGCIGRTGRGVCELTGVNPRDVDILMGTYTKSFGAAGGYVAGPRDVIEFLRMHAPSTLYGTSIAPAILQQIISSLAIISSTSSPGPEGNEGRQKLETLRDNTKYFRRRLQESGYHIIGHPDSPVVPLMIYNTCVGMYITRKLRDEGIGAVMVGFPATELFKARIRFCLSAGHTREMLDRVVEVLDEYSGPAGVVKTKTSTVLPKVKELLPKDHFKDNNNHYTLLRSKSAMAEFYSPRLGATRG